MQSSEYLSEKFKEILDKKLAGFKSDKTKYVYLARVSSLCDFAKKDFLDLTRQDVIRYFDIAKRRPENSKCLWLRIFRSVAKDVDAELQTKLLECFNIPETIEQEVYADPAKMPSLGDIDTLLSYLKDNGDDQLFLIINLMLETGISINELLSLKVGNVAVDTSGRVFLYFKPEVEEGIARYIPLSKNTAELLQNQGSKGEHDSQQSNIFINKYHKPLSSRTVQYELQKACQDADIKPVRLKDVKDIARAAMLKGGATADSLSHQTGLTKTWFFRLDRVVKDFDTSAASYNIIKVKSDV